MNLGFKQCIDYLLQKTILGKAQSEQEPAPVIPDMAALVEQAKQEWKNAANYFNNVSEPELVDHAILLREAAERRYMYLLKQAKREEKQAFLQESNIAQAHS